MSNNNPHITPPKLPLRFFRWFCRPEIAEDIEGDLVEQFHANVEEYGLKKTRRMFLWQVLLLFRPGIVRAFQIFKRLNTGTMFRHHLLIGWRNIKRNKGYTSINIIGLTVGLACFILIGMFVQYEYSYDTFHEKADRIYRIAKENPGGYYLGTNRFAVTPAPLVEALREEFPEVEYATQIRQVNGLFDHDGNPYYEDGIYATNEFFDVFTFPVLHGNPRTAIVEPNIIILTESMAQKYFGNNDPVGKTLIVTIANEKAPMEIAGIIRDIPANSHINFDYIISMRSRKIYGSSIDHWDNNNYYTYASLHPDHNFESFETKLNNLAKEKLGDSDYYKDHPDEITIFYPQALTDIHLRSHINMEPGVNGDIRYVRLFSGIAILILLIACINYINLSTARSVIRAKEVGIRKVIGAFRSQLTRQFAGEALIPTIVASILALGLVILLLPSFNRLTQREIELFNNSSIIQWLLLTGLSVGMLAGIYPALMLSRFNPVSTLKGGHTVNPGKVTLRNILVVIQFTMTIPLIISTIVIHRQLDYIHEANTGLSRDMVVTFPINDHSKVEHFPVLKKTLLSNKNVQGVSGSGKLPTQIISSSGTRRWQDAEKGQHISIYHTGVDQDFIDLLDLEIIQGRDFIEGKTKGDKEDMLINETLARQLGWDDPVGKWLHLNGRDGLIAGVMKDFNFLSFHQQMAPLALYKEPTHMAHVLVKISADNMPETLTFLEETMMEFSPDYPFEYQFLDDAYDKMYQTEIRLGNLFNFLTGLALLIACLGILGLAAFMASQRTKEIGIRKVLGASVAGIVILLSRDFLKLISIGFILAVPVAWLAMKRWLEDFAFRIELQWWMFGLAGISAILVALLTVSGQSIKAALADPVDSIRNE